MSARLPKTATIPSGITFALVTILCLILVGMTALTANHTRLAIHSSQGDAVRDLGRAGFVPVRSSFARAGENS